MSDAAVPPPPPSPAPAPAPLPVPPSATAPAGPPRLWQAALLFLAFGLLAGGSCAGFLNANMRGSLADTLALVFLATVPLAAGAFTLLAFRLWRRRAAEAWPSLAQCLLIGVAGAVLAVGGCGGWAATMEAVVAISVVFGALFVVGLAIGIGAAELFAVGVLRLILKRPGAR